MFSGLTNQVSSWMGGAKGGEQPEEKNPTPVEEVAPINTPDKKDSSSKLEMFSNVKTQIEGIGGWLGSSIPKLRKNEGDQENQKPLEADEALLPTEPEAENLPQKDDDNSSATGGADSGPQSIAESPTEEKDSQFGNVQSKALAGAKSFGSFLYSAVNKAGKTVSEASAKIKKTVEENSILGEFNKEQEAFGKAQANNPANALPPWTGCTNEEALKEECLSLSTDKRNFIRSPPTGVDFQFNYDLSYPVAMAIMEQDPNLEKMRYELVPKVVSEENFWRNYFYRVSLICQANEVSCMAREGGSHSGDSTFYSDQPMDVQVKESHEFVSDTLQPSTQDVIEVQEGMRRLAMGTKTQEEEWETELEAELQDYEVIGDNSNSKNDWEKEMEEILDEDLK